MRNPVSTMHSAWCLAVALPILVAGLLVGVRATSSTPTSPSSSCSSSCSPPPSVDGERARSRPCRRSRSTSSTRPYHAVDRVQDDVETTVLLLAVGLAVGYLASRARIARRRGRERAAPRYAGSIASPSSPPRARLRPSSSSPRAGARGRARLAALPLRSAAVRSAASPRRAQRNGHRCHRASLRSRRAASSHAKESSCRCSRERHSHRKIRARPDTRVGRVARAKGRGGCDRRTGGRGPRRTAGRKKPKWLTFSFVLVSLAFFGAVPRSTCVAASGSSGAPRTGALRKT